MLTNAQYVFLFWTRVNICQWNILYTIVLYKHSLVTENVQSQQKQYLEPVAYELANVEF